MPEPGGIGTVGDGVEQVARGDREVRHDGVVGVRERYAPPGRERGARGTLGVAIGGVGARAEPLDSGRGHRGRGGRGRGRDRGRGCGRLPRRRARGRRWGRRQGWQQGALAAARVRIEPELHGRQEGREACMEHTPSDRTAQHRSAPEHPAKNIAGRGWGGVELSDARKSVQSKPKPRTQVTVSVTEPGPVRDPS